MKVARQIRSSELRMILPDGSRGKERSNAAPIVDSESNELLGEEPSGYSGERFEKNVKLQSDVVEYEQLLETTAEVQLEGTRTQRDVLASRNRCGMECLRRFDEEYRCPTSSNFNKEAIIDLLKLSVSTRDLIKNLKTAKRIGRLKVDLGSLVDFSPRKSSLEDGGVVDDPTIAMTPRTSIDAHSQSAISTARSVASGLSQLPQEVSQSFRKLEELLALLHRKLPNSEFQEMVRKELTEITAAYFGQQGTAFGNAMVQLNAMAFTDVMQFIKAKVEGTNELLSLRVEAVEATRGAVEALKKAQNTDDGEYIEQLEKAIQAHSKALGDVLKVSGDRLNQLMMNSESDGNFRSAFESCCETMRKVVTERRAEHTELSKAIEHDQREMRKEWNRRAQENEKAHQRYVSLRASAFEAIEEYAQQQDQLWRQVEELVSKIGDIGRERAAVVKRTQENIELEWQRRRTFEEYVAVHEAHTNHLSTLHELSSFTMKVLDQADLFYDHMTTAVEAKNFEEGLHDLKVMDQLNFVKFYEEFIVTNVDYLGRKNARRLTAGRTVRLSESILAQDPHDADADHHRQVIRENTDLIDSLAKECDSIASATEKWEPLFESVAEQLDQCGLSFNDPRANWSALWERSVNETVNAALGASLEESAVIQEAQMNLEKNTFLAEAHEAAFRQKVQTSPPRRKPTREKRKVAQERSPRSSGKSPRPNLLG
jgi:hypothetical protein